MENSKLNTTSIIVGVGIVAVALYFLMKGKGGTKTTTTTQPKKLDFTPVNDPTISADGKSVTGTPATYWSKRAYTKLGYKDSATLNAKPNKDSITAIIGLDREPSKASSWNSTDYFWYFYDDTTDGSRRAMACRTDQAGQEREVVLFNMPSPTSNDRFGIKFDGTNVTWLVNGVDKATVTRISGDPLFAVVCLGKGTDIGFADINFTGVGDITLA
jgi:hypothetical protein